ncbi:MAG TPA: periplasmic heavy metal sensor [Prolixibacteraceae bacterium]|nr:periplasmic heavy metal sensor [Prolixibacteraceae bacterium]
MQYSKLKKLKAGYHHLLFCTNYKRCLTFGLSVFLIWKKLSDEEFVFKNNSMKTRLLIVVALFAFTTILTAQTPQGNPAVKPGAKVIGKLLNEQQRAPLQFLNLTDVQKEALKNNAMEMHKKTQPIRNELREAEVHQRTLMTAEKPDIKAINKNIERIGELKVEIAKITAARRLEMRALLTDEQRMKLDMHRGEFNRGQGKMEGRPGRDMNRLRFR